MAMNIGQLIKLSPEQLVRALFIIGIMYLASRLIIVDNRNTKLEKENVILFIEKSNYSEVRRIEDKKFSDSMNNLRYKDRLICDSIVTAILKEQLSKFDKVTKMADKQIQKNSNLIKKYRQ